MAGTARAVVVVLLVASAGCVGLSQRSLPDRLASYAGDPDNPYPGENLTVAIGPRDSERAFVPLVREALDYWERNDDRYLDYSVNFTVAPAATDPDLRVSFVPRLDRCGSVENAAGCAPRVTNPSQAAGTVEVRALDDLSDDSTVRVLEHELGHALGLRHGDAPRTLMRTHSRLTMLPMPNATERALAWDDPTLSVYVGETLGDRAAIREQIAHALGYYDRGAAGTVPENVSLRLVDDWEDADVVVYFPERSPCGSDAGSCGSVFGTDSDADGALERYSRVDITLTGLDTDAVGWHVARWLALGFGAQNESDYPPPLRTSTGYEERRSDWWR